MTTSPTRRAASFSVVRASSRQPLLGVAGLALVVPVVLLLAVGLGGAERSLLVLGPPAAFALSASAMITFWWEDWPSIRVRARWAGAADTGLVILLAAVMTVLGQVATGTVDLRAIVEPFADSSVQPPLAALLPLASAAFVVMLHLTLVLEGWPLRRLPRTTAGLLALGIAWAVAVALCTLLLGWSPFTGTASSVGDAVLSEGMFAAWSFVVGAWQIVIFVMWRGWPIVGIGPRSARLFVGNVLVVVMAAGTMALLTGPLDMVASRITATAACVVAAGLVVGMLFEGVLERLGPGTVKRLAILALAVGGTVILDLLLASYAVGLDWRRTTDEAWVTHAANVIAVVVLLHVGVGRRWPFASSQALPRPRSLD